MQHFVTALDLRDDPDRVELEQIHAYRRARQQATWCERGP